MVESLDNLQQYTNLQLDLYFYDFTAGFDRSVKHFWIAIFAFQLLVVWYYCTVINLIAYKLKRNIWKLFIIRSLISEVINLK